MKFKKEIKIVIEGEIFDESIDYIELFKSLKFSWKHWWQNNAKWIYGTPSEAIQAGRIDKMFINGMEIQNENNI